MNAAVAPGLVDQVRSRLSAEPGDVTPHRVAVALRSTGHPVGDATVLAVFEALRRESFGAGPLEALVDDPAVTDVLVNGADDVFVDRGRGLERVDVHFADEAAVRRLAVRLAAQGGRRLDDASPHVDVRLASGTRCHAVLAPIARPGTLISLRIPRRQTFDLTHLIHRDFVEVVRRVLARRLAFLISGGTGSGKTTLLSALLGEVDPTHRLVLVEDSSELRPDHPHVVGLESRPANVEGVGEVPMQVLVRQALRMRPDRLVVGEVRGGEVVDLLAALNTGHEGGCGTLHANTAADVPARVESLALSGSRALSRAAVHAQLGSGINAVLHVRRGADGTRQLSEIATLVRDENGLVRIETAWELKSGEVRPGPGANGLRAVLESP